MKGYFFLTAGTTMLRTTLYVGTYENVLEYLKSTTGLKIAETERSKYNDDESYMESITMEDGTQYMIISESCDGIGCYSRIARLTPKGNPDFEGIYGERYDVKELAEHPDLFVFHYDNNRKISQYNYRSFARYWGVTAKQMKPVAYDVKILAKCLLDAADTMEDGWIRESFRGCATLLYWGMYGKIYEIMEQCCWKLTDHCQEMPSVAKFIWTLTSSRGFNNGFRVYGASRCQVSGKDGIYTC